MDTTVQVRVNHKTKQKVKKILNDLGLDLSTAINVYLKQIELQQAIPFPLVRGNSFRPAEEKRMIAESDKIKHLVRQGKLKTYRSAQDLFDDLSV